jgi:hypothetical protein
MFNSEIVVGMYYNVLLYDYNEYLSLLCIIVYNGTFTVDRCTRDRCAYDVLVLFAFYTLN